MSKFTERLNAASECGAEFWLDGKNVTPAIIEALEAAEQCLASDEDKGWLMAHDDSLLCDTLDELERRFEALDALIVNPKGVR